MKMIVLGTGNATVTACYNTCFVLLDEERPAGDRCLLVDGGGGNGLLTRMKQAGIDWKEVRSIFLSHRHMDHLTGIFWMMRNILNGMKHDTYEGEAVIYGHEEVVHILRESAALLFTPEEYAFLDERLHLVTVEDGEVRTVIGRRMVFFDVGSAKTLQFGFQIALDTDQDSDGRAGSGQMDIGTDGLYGALPEEAAAGGDAPRRVLTFCGDEPCHESGFPYADHAEWLLFEAFCLQADAERFRPYEKGHSTVTDACELAGRLQAGNLILYHTEDTDLAHRKQRYRKEGLAHYSGNLLVPDDLEVIDLR